MPERHDAFLAAAEIALAVEAAVHATSAVDIATVGTVGICEVFPGAVYSIPSRVRLTADVRDTDLARRDRVLGVIKDQCAAIALARGVRVTDELLNADPPAQSSQLVVDALTQACSELGLPALPMVSRAYHDSLFMSRIAQTAMLFIPCRGGVSHRPDGIRQPGRYRARCAGTGPCPGAAGLLTTCVKLVDILFFAMRQRICDCIS